MSILTEKIQAELVTIDLKALIVQRATIKIDSILENKNISGIIDNEIDKRISQAVKSELQI